MTIKEIAGILDAEVLTANADLDREVHAACGSDMMSDVLAYVKTNALLLTGLNNPQVVRTASMMDMGCVVFVRGKMPDESIVRLAEEQDIILLSTQKTMYPACGLLYQAGLRGEACE